jgi:hypothetical protein
VRNERELQQILELQQLNLARSVNADEIASQGFVTVEHSLELLRQMHALAPSIVAIDGDVLAGYALVMPVECRALLPILAPMFARLDQLGITDRFYIMGQICVARAWRGRGLFDRLYDAHRRFMRGTYDHVITEVATRNVRSMRAHERVGFETVDCYRDATDEWALLRWSW